MTVAISGEQDRTTWGYVDTLLQELGINTGPPLGMGEHHITTTLKPLQKLLQDINPPTREEMELETIQCEDGTEWRVHKDYYLGKQWKGQFGRVFVVENVETGKYRKLFIPQLPTTQRFKMLMDTLSVRITCTMEEAELQAQKRLFEALSDVQRSCYITSDTFLEVGKSGTLYFLRKSKPTIAMRQREDGGANVLCALCLHPVAYYTGTWAGVLPPSDEVLTHLLMIRGVPNGEHFFWRKANQIPHELDNSGI